MTTPAGLTELLSKNSAIWISEQPASAVSSYSSPSCTRAHHHSDAIANTSLERPLLELNWVIETSTA